MKLSTTPLLGVLAALFFVLPLSAADSVDWNDSVIASRLWAKYAASASINPISMDVEVNDGDVILRGTLDNRAEVVLAETLAKKTKGVKSVTNHLNVEDKTKKETPIRDAVNHAGEEITDAYLATAVKTKLLANKHVTGFTISVDADDQVVILTGTVNSDKAKKMSDSIAHSVSGVKSVENRLTVENSDDHENQRKTRLNALTSMVDETWVETKINAQYAVTDGLNPLNISVDVKDETAFLKGTVDNRAEKELACAIAQDTVGVSQVYAGALKVK